MTPKNRAKRALIHEKRKGKYTEISTSSDLQHGDRIAGNRWAWCSATFSTTDAVHTYRHRMDAIPNNSIPRRNPYRHNKVRHHIATKDRIFRRLETEEGIPPIRRKWSENFDGDCPYKVTQKNWKKFRKTRWKPRD